MYKVHMFLGGRKVVNQRFAHLPRNGDTVRLPGEKYAKVTEVIWCLDEDSDEGQRVNVRLEALAEG